MARYRDSQCRLCRREGMKLFLKGDRCYSDKCAIERRGYPPGQHGLGRTDRSDFRTQLREKQKVRRIYGIMERQFRDYVARAEKIAGVAGENLLILLERRFDNVVFRMGFANSRQEARQLVRHGHFRINNKKANIPSMLLNVGDNIEVRDSSKKVQRIVDSLKALDRRGMPNWVDTDATAMKGNMKALPTRTDITMPIEEQLIVEFYSR